MAGGKIDILVSPDVKKFPSEMESGLRGAIGTATKIGSAIGVALGGAATVKSIAEIGLEFDQTMNTMSAVSQASEAQLRMVEQAARDLGKSSDLTATSASDAASAMTELVKGGFSVDEAMSAAKGTLQLASAAQIEAAEAATIQSQALQSFGLDASYAATASDVLAGAANASSAEIGGIAQGLQQSGAVANQFGLTLEDNATALAMFANAGIQGSDAGTLLKSALLALTDQGKPAQAAIEELGLSVYDAQGKFVGMETLFGELSAAQAKMTDEQYQAATATLFGSDAMRLAGIAAAQGAEGWNQTYAAVTRSGQAAEVAAAQAAGLPGVLEAIENQSEDTAIAIYDAFSGLALEGGQGLVSLIENVAPMLEDGARTIAGGIEAALPTVERVVDVVATGVSEIGGSLSTIGGAGLAMVESIGGVLGGVGGGVLDLTENLQGMTGPLLAAGAALAIGKWKDWDGSLRSGAGSVQSLGTRIMETARMQERLSQSVMQGSSHVEGIAQDYVEAGVSARSLGAAIETQVPWIGRAAQAYRENGAELRTWSANSKRWANDASDLAGEVHTLETNFHRGMGAATGMAGVLGGGLAAGGSIAKSAIGGLVDAFGGPLNLAIAGATMAVAGITSAIDRTRRSTELLEQLGDQAESTGQALYGSMSRGDLTGSISALNAGLEGLLDTQRQLQDTGPGFWGTIKAMGEDYITSFNPFDGRDGNDVYDEFSAQKEAARQAKEFSAAIEEAGITAESAATAVGGSAAQYESLIAMLDLTTEGGREAKAAFDEQRDAYLRMQEITDSLAPGAVELSEAMATIGDEAAGSEERVKALGDALDNLLGIDPTADEALMALHEEIDSVVESAEQAVDQTAGFGESLFGGSLTGGLNEQSENARTLNSELRGMRERLLDVGIAGEDVDAAFAAQQPALDALATKYGISGDRVRELAAEMGGVPATVKTVMEVSTSEALSGIEELWGAVEKGQVLVGEPITLDFDNIDESVEQLEELGFTIEEVTKLDDGSGAIKFTADTQSAVDNVQMLIDIMMDVASGKDITITSNSAEEIEAIKSLGAQVEDLGDGKFKLQSNSPEEIKYLVEIGALIKDEKTGEIQINSNLDEVLRKSKEIDDRNGKRSTETLEVIRLERTIRSTEYANSAGGTIRISGTMQADGSVRTAASGLLSQQDAQIAPGGSWLLWAEDETKGESFIPHAPEKRGRSTQILAATAGIFGLGLVDAGGNPIGRDGTSVAPTGQTFADGGIRSAAEILAYARGESVAGQRASRSLEGATYVRGGFDWGDCSSAQGQLALFAVDRPAATGRFMYTGNQREQLSSIGFQSGMGGPGDFSIGWIHGASIPGGGHTSGTIDGVNLEMGGARGNGQIGGGAAPANHPQYAHQMHLPLSGGGLGSLEEITSTSVDGFTYSRQGRGTTAVSWGEAQQWHDIAAKNLKLYDTGGIIPTGGMALNLSGPERVLPADLTRSFDRFVQLTPALVAALSRGDVGGARVIVEGLDVSAWKNFDATMLDAHSELKRFAMTLGGDFLGQTKVVMDAEKGLAQTRKNIAQEARDLTLQELAVQEAKENLAKAEADGGEQSLSMTRKLEDAERKLDEARAGSAKTASEQESKAKRIADAERSLARAHEDAAIEAEKNADSQSKAIIKARQQVEEAEADLAEMRELGETAAARMEAAERTVAAARIQAAGDLVAGIGNALATVAGSVANFYQTLAQYAQQMEQQRQELAAQRLEVNRLSMARRRAALDAVIAEQDLAAAKAQGAINIANAEASLAGIRQEAIESTTAAGETGVEAMSRAVDRFRVSGVFAVERVSQATQQASYNAATTTVGHVQQVAQAEQDVQIARAEAAMAELTATHMHQMALLDLQEATIHQQYSVDLLDLSTQNLARTAEILGDMTAEQAQNAANGWSGVAETAGGLGKFVTGAVKAFAAFTSAGGGPQGAIAALVAGGMDLVTGFFDVVDGGKKVIDNWSDINAHMEGMPWWEKVITVGAVALGGALPWVTAADPNSNAEDVEKAAETGAEIIKRTAETQRKNIEADMEKAKRENEKARAELDAKFDQQQADIDAKRWQLEMDYTTEAIVRQSDIDIANYLQQIAAADTTEQANALAAAAEVAATRRDEMLDILSRQYDLLESQATTPKPSITINVPPDTEYVPMEIYAETVRQFQEFQNQVEIKTTSVSGASYVQARV